MITRDSLKTRAGMEEVLRCAVQVADSEGHKRPAADAASVRWYAGSIVGPNMRRFALESPEHLQFPLQDVLNLAGMLEDGEFDAFFMELFAA